jgi:hypothetical protein
MLNTLQYRISQHQRLSELRIKLLRLHKLLLDTERLTYYLLPGIPKNYDLRTSQQSNCGKPDF